MVYTVLPKCRNTRGLWILRPPTGRLDGYITPNLWLILLYHAALYNCKSCGKSAASEWLALRAIVGSQATIRPGYSLASHCLRAAVSVYSMAASVMLATSSYVHVSVYIVHFGFLGISQRLHLWILKINLSSDILN